MGRRIPQLLQGQKIMGLGSTLENNSLYGKG
jgi:hypothetical protein